MATNSTGSAVVTKWPSLRRGNGADARYVKRTL
jgi:hypothetical protein